MSFDTFLNKIDFIRFKYMVPFFLTLSIFFSSFLAPLGTEPLVHEFTVPEEDIYVGETLEITQEYKIIIGENASVSEKNAAEKLKKYLKEISGINLEIERDTVEDTEKEIIIGKTSREGISYTIDRENLGDDGIVIKTVGEKIILSGAEQRGAIYSVYNFLEKYFDCHWFTYDLTVIPQSEKLIIPSEIDYTYVPDITFRSTDWISAPRSNEYKAANGLNDGIYGFISDEYGSCIQYASSFGHTMQSLVDKAYFDEDPTLFALGKQSRARTTDQLCLTNERTLEITIASVRKWLDKNPRAEIVSVTQNDNQNYCVCENCKKIDKEEGSHAGTMIRFVNAIADNIKDDYPNVMVDTFAYQYTRTPPKITVPRDNVIVRLCSIECSFSTPLNSGECKANTEFAEDLRAWSQICKNLYIFDYTTNYAHFLAPFGNFDVLQENLKFFRDNNITGVYEEGNYMASKSDGEFAELRSYMIARLMWDPDCDIDKLMYDFCKAYYGDGAQGIIDFINFIDENNGGHFIELSNWWITPFPSEIEFKTGTNIYTPITFAATLRADEDDIEKVNAMWQTALDGAGTDWQMENTERSMLCWRYWKACNKYGEFSDKNEEARIEENKKLYEDFVRFGITYIAENRGVLSNEPFFEKTPDLWTTFMTDMLNNMEKVN